MEGWVIVLEARAWSDLGILERLTLGFGGFRVFFFLLLFPPPVMSGERDRATRPDTRYNCWVPWVGKEVPCFCFMRWVGDVGWISGWLVV